MQQRQRPLAPTRARLTHGQIEPQRVALTDRLGRVTAIAQAHRDQAQTPLDRYRARGQLDGDPHRNERRWRAGDRLRSDHHLAGLDPHVTWNWDGVGAGEGGAHGLTPTERQIGARRRLRDALGAVGPRLAPVLVAVCCEETDAGQWAGRKGRVAQIEGMVTLRIALDLLGDFYGLV